MGLSAFDIALEKEAEDFDFEEIDRRLGAPEPLPDHIDRRIYLDAVCELSKRLDVILSAIQNRPKPASIGGLRIALGTTPKGQASLASEIGCTRAAISFHARRIVESLGMIPAASMRKDSEVKKCVRARHRVLNGERKAEALHIPKDRLAHESAEMRECLSSLPEGERARAMEALTI